MKVLGVIVARGGSKGIPGKNLKPINGKPLIGYSIDAAQGSSLLTRFIVSTDSEEIAEYSKSRGVDIPFLRPTDLSDDVVSPLYAIIHAKEYMESIGEYYDAFMMLQPTAPFRESEDIDGAISLLDSTGADSVISVVDVHSFHPARMKFINDGKLIDPPYCEAYENQRRQELETIYIRNGAIYLTKKDTLEKESFKGEDCRAWIMSSKKSVNIDSDEDLLYAEFLHSKGMIR